MMKWFCHLIVVLILFKVLNIEHTISLFNIINNLNNEKYNTINLFLSSINNKH